jgi:hypothetical protein
MSSKKEDNESWVLPWNRIPARPINLIMLAAVSWLYMDKYHCPSWAIGVIATIFVLPLIGTICLMITQKTKDIVFKEELESEATSPYKSLWNRGRMQ